jgi:hypothetical protein
MTFRQRITAVVTAGLFAGFSVVALAQEQKQDKPQEGERQRTEATTMTGCLAKGDTAGSYILTNPGDGTKTTVTPAAGVDIEKHAANHTVKLTGSKRADGTFVASNLEHVSATCEAKK